MFIFLSDDVLSLSDVPIYWTPVRYDFRCRNLGAEAGVEESYSYFLWYSGQQQGQEWSTFTPVISSFSLTETGNMSEEK